METNDLLFMKVNTLKQEKALRSLNAKCDRILEIIEKIERNYVHNDMDSLLKAARECADKVKSKSVQEGM